MSTLEQNLAKIPQSRFFAYFDFTHSYWKLPLHPNSQKFPPFIIPAALYTPALVPHRSTNAVTQLQSSLTHTLTDDIKSTLLLWLDDCLLHESSVDNFLNLVR